MLPENCHLLKGISGKSAETCLEAAGIVLNRNVMPGDADSPGRVSGIRIGTGALSARGMGDNEMRQIADLMDITMMGHKKNQGLSEVKEKVIKLCRDFPIKTSI